MKKAGLDNGNYALKLWEKEKTYPVQIPTIVSESVAFGNDLLAGEESDIPKEELFQNIDVTINSKAIQSNGKRYIVGQKVLEDNLEPEELENHSDKSTDDITAILGLSGLAVNEIYNNYDQDEIKETYDIGISLPVNTISLEKADFYAERFIGQHEIIFHHPSERTQKVILDIQFAKTLPEGSAGAWGIIYNEDGSSKKWTIRENDNEVKQTLEDNMLLHFDIGAGTTEQVLTDGVAYKPKQSFGHAFGVKETIEKIRNKWNHSAKPNEKIDSVTEFNSIYFNKEDPRHHELIAESKPYFQQLAKRMSKIIINKIDELKTKPVTFIYGGGSIVLESYLRDELQSKGRMDRVIFLNDPINVTAKGLLVYASSPRYEAKKEELTGVENSGS